MKNNKSYDLSDSVIANMWVSIHKNFDFILERNFTLKEFSGWNMGRTILLKGDLFNLVIELDRVDVWVSVVSVNRNLHELNRYDIQLLVDYFTGDLHTFFELKNHEEETLYSYYAGLLKSNFEQIENLFKYGITDAVKKELNILNEKRNKVIFDKYIKD